MLRPIFDNPDLVTAMAAAKGSEKTRLMVDSVVQRGDQDRKAEQPDIMTPSRWWIETQSAGAATYNPLHKLEQAERDVGQRLTENGDDGRWDLPVAVCSLKGSPKIIACMRMSTLLEATGVRADEVSLALRPLMPKIPVTIPFETFQELLEHEHARR
jgi:hypothetical protein